MPIFKITDPKELDKHDVADFLTHHAADKNLAADTQRVALVSS